MQFFRPALLSLGLINVAQAYQPGPFLPPPMPSYLPPPAALMRVPPGYLRQPIYPGPIYYGYQLPYPAQPRSIEPQVPAKAQGEDAPPAEQPPAPPEVAEQTREPAPQSAAGTTPNEQQQAFLQLLAPIVARENDRLLRLRAQALKLLADLDAGALDDSGQVRLRKLATKYRVQGDPVTDPQVRQDLLTRIDAIPTELALAQAVNESGWGTSRFAREGNNLFGIWTYDKSKGMVPRGRPEGATHLVRRFDSLDESVRYYLHNLNSHPAYRELRDLRAQMRARGEAPSGLVLAAGLTRYSAKGEIYVRLIRELIQRYRLAALALGNTPAA